MRISRHPLALSTLAIALLTALGWGWWGYGATGDWSLEFADAHRLWLGHVPYRDFIPTYGILTAALMAPFFALKGSALAGTWFTAALLILAETAMVWRLLRPRDGRFEGASLGLLFVALVAFLPSNSRFILGYSTAGFASVLLWTFFFLARRSRPGASLLAGILLGAQCFTKLDAGLAAGGILFFLLLLLALRRHWMEGARLLAGFVLPSAIVWGGLLATGARVDLLWGSTAEAIGQTGYVRDLVLGKRLLAGSLFGALAAAACFLPAVRDRLPLVRRALPPLVAAMALLATGFDGANILGSGGERGPVALFYFWFLCWLVAGVLMAAELAAQRSFAGMLGQLEGWRWTVLLLGAAGLARCAMSGWFPINYYQPSFFLAFAWLTLGGGKSRAGLASAMLWSAAALAILVAALGVLPRSSVPFRTPFGTIRLHSGADWSEPVEIYRTIRDDPTAGSLLCTYMTGPFAATGREPAGLYTYGHRMGFAQRYRAERERDALASLKARPPLYVLLEKERATFAPPFGKDFGVEIAAWIGQHYRESAHSRNGAGGEWTLLRRNDAPPPPP
jgi:hypothetical protein